MLKKKIDWKELGIDILVDLAAGMLGAVGIYNFALNANFPVAGFSGIAIILYHLFKIPVGAGMILLNIPVHLKPKYMENSVSRGCSPICVPRIFGCRICRVIWMMP